MISIAAWDNVGTICKSLREKTLRLRDEQRTINDSHYMSFVILKCPMSVQFRNYKRKNSYEKPLETGGGGGIRTHGTLACTTVFETAPFDHSGTPPEK